jgi:cold shock CspA family protein
MEGTLKTLNREKRYGFIKSDKADYFFHRDDFDGHWEDLADDYDAEQQIKLEFEPTRTSKGLRAEEVRRLDRGV